MCPGRSAARSGALQTRDRCSPWRSRISGAPRHFVSRCAASGTRGSRFRGDDISSEWHKVFMAAKRPPALDRIDVKILAALQRDGRSTIQKLAQAVGLSPRASLERVRRLEASGVIAGYQAVVDLGRLARPINVFAEIILERQANRGRFEKRLAAIDDVVECWEVSGT